MATKKQSAEATAEETTEVTGETSATTETTESTDTTESTENTATVVEAKKSWCYIGPTIPGGKLKNNTLLRGTRTEVLDFYADVLKLYPEVKNLIVETDDLASARYELRQQRGFLYYSKQKVDTRVKAALTASK